VQQSLCRDCNFENSDLKGASFFDGDLTGANMEGADVSQVASETRFALLADCARRSEGHWCPDCSPWLNVWSGQLRVHVHEGREPQGVHLCARKRASAQTYAPMETENRALWAECRG
jgi:uncharacterized protein YjbI with pentapeptide repeats